MVVFQIMITIIILLVYCKCLHSFKGHIVVGTTLTASNRRKKVIDGGAVIFAILITVILGGLIFGTWAADFKCVK